MNRLKTVFPKQLYTPRKPISNVYIHLPFCQKKCHFCAFPVHAIGSIKRDHSMQLMNQYLKNLIKQIEFGIQNSLINEPLKSLYLGGGTPSLYNLKQLKQIYQLFPIDKKTQITIEVNPSEINQLKYLKDSMINRFSIGIQTFNKQILQKMNRDFITQKSLLIDIIHENRPLKLSLDFIIDFCLDKKYFNEMIQFIKLIKPEHITLYLLQTNQGSYLHKHRNKFQWIQKDEVIIERYLEASKCLVDFGYQHYEISNFSLNKNCESQHSSIYWEGNQQFLSFGMGSTSLTQGIRATRPSNLKKYYKFINLLSQFQFLDSEQLSLQLHNENGQKQIMQTVILSGLRRAEGIKWSKIQKICKVNFQKIRSILFNKLKQIKSNNNQLIIWKQIDQRICLSIPHGYLLADEISFQLIKEIQKQKQ